MASAVHCRLTVEKIDTSNITNAFVSGMKEDLNLYQNQYNYVVLSWTIGYIIGQWVRVQGSSVHGEVGADRDRLAFQLHLDSSTGSQ